MAKACEREPLYDTCHVQWWKQSRQKKLSIRQGCHAYIQAIKAKMPCTGLLMFSIIYGIMGSPSMAARVRQIQAGHIRITP